jgi:hypothetical protein
LPSMRAGPFCYWSAVWRIARCKRRIQGYSPWLVLHITSLAEIGTANVVKKVI